MHPKKSLIFQGTRFIPLSLKRRGGGEERGASPLLIKYFPLPLIREGGQGDGFLKISRNLSLSRLYGKLG